LRGWQKRLWNAVSSIPSGQVGMGFVKPA